MLTISTAGPTSLRRPTSADGAILLPAPTAARFVHGIGWTSKGIGAAIAEAGAAVAKRADVKRLFDETRAKLGKPSILVNNAGVYKFGALEAVTDEDFHRHFDTNVLGPILATQEAVKAFDGAGGSVIDISTISNLNPSPNTPLYSASKARSTRSPASSRSSWRPREFA